MHKIELFSIRLLFLVFYDESTRFMTSFYIFFYLGPVWGCDTFSLKKILLSAKSTFKIFGEYPYIIYEWVMVKGRFEFQPHR